MIVSFTYYLLVHYMYNCVWLYEHYVQKKMYEQLYPPPLPLPLLSPSPPLPLLSPSLTFPLPKHLSMEVPVLWVRVDPEYQWIRQLSLEQSDIVWQCLLKYERDANAQLDALEALETFQTNQTRDAFRDTIMNSSFYHRVREQAAKSLSKVCQLCLHNLYVHCVTIVA